MGNCIAKQRLYVIDFGDQMRTLNKYEFTLIDRTYKIGSNVYVIVYAPRGDGGINEHQISGVIRHIK